MEPQWWAWEPRTLSLVVPGSTEDGSPRDPGWNCLRERANPATSAQQSWDQLRVGDSGTLHGAAARGVGTPHSQLGGPGFEPVARAGQEPQCRNSPP